MANKLPVDRTASRVSVRNRLIFRLFQVCNTLQRQSARQIGVTTVEWAVLGALSRPQACDGMSVNALADFLIVSRQNLDGVLRRLEREARVTRSADAVDRRTRQVKMTSCGQIFWLDLQPKIHEFYLQSLVNFRFDDKISLVHYLNKLQHDMDNLSLMPRCGPAGHSLN